MARGCVAPECTLGMGAATKCAVWREVTARDGVRTSHLGLPWQLATFLEARPSRPRLWARGGPKEDKNKKGGREMQEGRDMGTYVYV